jgi:hypothetical protein
VPAAPTITASPSPRCNLWPRPQPGRDLPRGAVQPFPGAGGYQGSDPFFFWQGALAPARDVDRPAGGFGTFIHAADPADVFPRSPPGCHLKERTKNRAAVRLRPPLQLPVGSGLSTPTCSTAPASTRWRVERSPCVDHAMSRRAGRTGWAERAGRGTARPGCSPRPGNLRRRPFPGGELPRGTGAGRLARLGGYEDGGPHLWDPAGIKRGSSSCWGNTTPRPTQ